ncbi:TIR domain-containing protein [Solihabitans fulvus]|uniref:TIR domain-containing protein n=1 Tax=Solihabitans fulvus TaxID=1892852 RepID=UPI0016621865|nr:TIR domain-containing protein [Solihabitans fulvus]
MSGVFVNYRQGRHSAAVSALALLLARHFGSELVFCDTNLPPGGRYPDQLRAKLRTCDVLIAVLHAEWLQDLHARAERDDVDWVHYEIKTALEEKKVVLPVLLDDAGLPARDALPNDITELVMRQRMILRATHFTNDLGDLVLELENHVPRTWRPTTPREDKRASRARFPLTVIGWFAATLLLPLPFCLPMKMPLWAGLTVSAVVSALVLAAITLLIAMLQPVNWACYRLERRMAVLSFRSYLSRSWVVMVPATLMIVMGWLDLVAPIPGRWHVYAVVAGLIALGSWLQRVLLRQDTLDREWPPRVTLEPRGFRRAAVRLHTRLTTEPQWGRQRPRDSQEQAAAIYRDLTAARLTLLTKADRTRRGWLAHSQPDSGRPPCFLGWAASITILQSAALMVALDHDAASARMFLITVGVVLVTIGLTVLALCLDFSFHRSRYRWQAQEIAEWQAVLEPLVFTTEADVPISGGQCDAVGAPTRSPRSPGTRVGRQTGTSASLGRNGVGR